MSKLLAIVLALGAPTLLAQNPTEAGAEQSAKTVRTGAHYEIVCHFTGPHAARLSEEALEIAEAVWGHSEELYGKMKTPKMPLQLHLYPDAAGYEAAEQKLTGGKFKRNLAFAHFGSNTAHVAMHPACSEEAHGVFGLTPQTKRLVSHETAHLARYHSLPNHRIHPAWFADGVASWLDHEVLRGLGMRASLNEEPYESSAIGQVQRLAAAGQLPSVRKILHDEIDVEFNARYALRDVFFRFLREKKQRRTLDKIMKKIFAIGESPNAPAELRETTDNIIGKRNYEKLDKAFAKYIDSLDPEWQEVVRCLGSFADGWVQAAFPNVNAICWRTEAVTESNYTVHGNLTLLPAPPTVSYAPQLNVLLGNNQDGYVSVAMHVDGVTVFDFVSEGNRWNSISTAEFAGLQIGQEVEFEIAVSGDQVVVTLDQIRVAIADLDGRDMTGPWGLGAQAGRAGLWRDVGVDTKKKRRAR